jgi:uncharacterized damage-inducible protein DinB
MIQPPHHDEYPAYYGRYIQRVPIDQEFFGFCAAQPDELRQLLHRVSDEQATTPPKAGEWSIKQVVGHINDAERILAYRAMCMARGDTTPLPGFEQDDYVRGASFNRRSLPSLIEEFASQRHANVLCFQDLADDELTRRGTASGGGFSVRAMLYTLAGHVNHHLYSLAVDYALGG